MNQVLRNKLNRIKYLLLFLMLAMLCGCQASASIQTGSAEETLEQGDALTLHFLDVGQGLSILVENEGQYLLYDGGDRNASSFVVSYLKEQNVDQLSYVVASHFDADHLNGIVGVLNAFPVSTVIAPDYTTETNIYKSYLQVMASKQYEQVTPEPGSTFALGDAVITILGPIGNTYEKANDYSIILRIDHGDDSVLITGDAEYKSEQELVQSGANLSCDIYVAGHHGSASSSSFEFLEQALPESVVISCAENSSYGHPHEETMEKFIALEADLYRTDKQGTITATSDGSGFQWSTEPCEDTSYGGEESPAQTEAALEDFYVVNLSSGKIHRPSCSGVETMSPENRKDYAGLSVTEILTKDHDYTTCKRCNPS